MHILPTILISIHLIGILLLHSITELIIFIQIFESLVPLIAWVEIKGLFPLCANFLFTHLKVFLND